MILMALVVADLGTGLGFGLRRREKINKQAAQIQNSTSASLKIFEDTSLAAIWLPNGDRKAFFQEATGRIRQISYYSRNASWTADSDADTTTPVAYDARNYTPMAITAYPEIHENLLSTNVSLSSTMQLFVSDIAHWCRVGIYFTWILGRL